MGRDRMALSTLSADVACRGDEVRAVIDAMRQALATEAVAA